MTARRRAMVIPKAIPKSSRPHPGSDRVVAEYLGLRADIESLRHLIQSRQGTRKVVKA